MFKLHSKSKPTGDQPQTIEYLSKGIKRREKISDTFRGYRFWKNFYNGKYNTKSTKTNISFGTQQNFSRTTVFRI